MPPASWEQLFFRQWSKIAQSTVTPVRSFSLENGNNLTIFWVDRAEGRLEIQRMKTCTLEKGGSAQWKRVQYSEKTNKDLACCRVTLTHSLYRSLITFASDQTFTRACLCRCRIRKQYYNLVRAQHSTDSMSSPTDRKNAQNPSNGQKS